MTWSTAHRAQCERQIWNNWVAVRCLERYFLRNAHVHLPPRACANPTQSARTRKLYRLFCFRKNNRPYQEEPLRS